MTYLTPPRLHFAGTFLASPSTVNNSHENVLDADTTDTTGYRDRAWTTTSDGTGGWWNPNGNHEFSFTTVTVQSAVGADGEPVTGDPVVGLQVTTPNRATAKIVDLDQDEQMTSTIYGLEIVLRDDAGEVFLRAKMTPTPFTDIWHGIPALRRSAGASAAYHSTLTDLRWPDASSSSPLLVDLRSRSATDGLLSIKFNVDGYAGPKDASRIVGSIGPAAVDEPAHVVAGRHLGGPEIRPFPVPNPGFDPRGRINFFPGLVDRAARKIRLDLGNALPTAPPKDGGDALDLGELTLAYRDTGGVVTPIGPIGYRETGWYTRTAGVTDVPAGRALTDAELAGVAAGPLLIVTGTGAQQEVHIEEPPVHVQAEEFVHRLDAEAEQVVRFRVTELGVPKEGATVVLAVRPPPVPEDLPPDVLRRLLGGLTFPAQVTTDSSGVAEVTLAGHDPGTERFFNALDTAGRPESRGTYDGQVYLVGYGVGEARSANPSHRLAVLVWNAFPAQPPPDGQPLTWNGEIGPVLRTFGNLYPHMTVNKNIDLDMADYDHVVDRAPQIADRLGLPITDPRYMPVTRDLSGQRTKAILEWLEDPVRGDDAPQAAEGQLPQPVAHEADPNVAELGDKGAFAARLAEAGRDAPS